MAVSASLGTPRISMSRRVAARLRRNPGAWIGAVILLAFLTAAVFAPQIAPYDHTRQNILRRLQPPSEEHRLGTDELGRDILSRIIFGTRVSLQVGLISVSISGFFGTAFGLAAGYFRRLDNVIMRFMDILLAFPGILLAMAIVAALGPGLYNSMVAIGIWAIPVYARVTRGSVLGVKQTEYIEASRALGVSEFRIIFRHILPNIASPLIVLSTMRIATAILSAASLSFLGLGAQPPIADWGGMLSAGRMYVRDAPWVAVFPGMAITLTVLGFNLFGEALREALDPQVQKRN